MWDLLGTYGSFLPYLSLLVFLTVMSVREGARGKNAAAVIARQATTETAATDHGGKTTLAP